MMLDSFVVGSVSGAREELLSVIGIHIDHPKTLRASIARFAWGDVARLWNKSATAVAPLQGKRVESIDVRPRYSPDQVLRRNRQAAVLVAVRRILWAVVVGAGLVLQFSH